MMETSIFSFINHHIPPSKSWFLLKPFILLFCLTLVFLKLKSVTRQASVVLLSVMSTLSIIVTLPMLLVMILPSLLWQILIMLNTLFVWGRLITLYKPLKHFRTLSTLSSLSKQYVISSRLEVWGLWWKEKATTQASLWEGKVGTCWEAFEVDYGGLKEGYVVQWD